MEDRIFINNPEKEAKFIEGNSILQRHARQKRFNITSRFSQINKNMNHNNYNNQGALKITATVHKILDRSDSLFSRDCTTTQRLGDYKLKRQSRKRGNTEMVHEPSLLRDLSEKIKHSIKSGDGFKNEEKAMRPNSSFLKNSSDVIRMQSNNHNKRLSEESPKIPLRIILQRNPTRPFLPPPVNITAFSYIIMEDNNVIHSFLNMKIALEIASLTKIMTCLIILRIVQKNAELLQQVVEIGILETNIIGTTAEIEKGEKYTIEQLLYGLMLPSGNDASLALACWGGKQLYSNITSDCFSELQEKSVIKLTKKREAIQLFVDEMNILADQLQMKKTKYSNPHGLSSIDNKSTCYDLALLCKQAMKNNLFRKIVGTQTYQTVILDNHNKPKKIYWENTHKLLVKSEYLGIKTGITTTAGGCLASYLTIANRNFIIIVLKCEQNERKFKETDSLKKWLMKKEGLRLLSKPDNKPDDECLDL